MSESGTPVLTAVSDGSGSLVGSLILACTIVTMPIPSVSGVSCALRFFLSVLLRSPLSFGVGM